jgi:hypothetical protein
MNAHFCGDTVVFQYVNFYMFRAALAYHQGVQSYINNRVTFISSPPGSSTVERSSIFDVQCMDMCTVIGAACWLECADGVSVNTQTRRS